MSALALGGLDQWTGGGGAAGELRAAAWSDAILPGQSYLGLILEGVAGSGWSDSLVGGLGMRLGEGRWTPELAVVARASALSPTPWFESMVPLLVHTSSVELSAGPFVRLGSDHVIPGLMGGALTSVDVSPRWSVVGRGEVRGHFFHADVPPALFDGGLGTEYLISSRLSADLWSGFLLAWWADVSDRVAGLPAQGSSTVYGRLAFELALTPAWSVRGEGSSEHGWGQVAYDRFRAFAGVAFRATRTRRTTPKIVTVEPGPREFVLDSPLASSVEILGSFTEWTAVPLTKHADGRWTVILPLEEGMQEYAYRVDGVMVVPPETDQRRPDDFGGENGVIIVFEPE